MTHKDDALENLGLMRACLQETLREAAEIRATTFEEETLIAFEKVNKTCTSALRYAKQAEKLLKQAKN